MAIPMIGRAGLAESHICGQLSRHGHDVLKCLEVHGDDYDKIGGSVVRDYIHVMGMAEAHCGTASAHVSEAERSAAERASSHRFRTCSR